MNTKLAERQSDAAAVTNVDIIACEGCAKPNRRDRQFCAGCGISLWHTCPQCKASMTVNELFCGKCGTSLQQHVINIRSKVVEAVRTCRKLRDEQQIARALQALDTISIPQFAGLLDVKTEVQQLRQELTHLHATMRRQAEEAELVGRDCIAHYKYSAAVDTLSQIPEAYRTPEVNGLLKSAQTNHEESLRLRAKIVKYVEEKRLEELSPTVDRYLALRPDDVKALSLSHHIEKLLCQKIERQLKKCQYQKAREIVQSLPMQRINESTKRLMTHVELVTQLADVVNESLVVDAVVVEAARRWAELCPHDLHAVERYREVSRRHKNAVTSMIPWANVGSPMSLGFPMQLLPASLTPTIPSTDAAKAPASDFAVACGLALQGLGLARLPLNLLRTESSDGWLSRWKPAKSSTGFSTVWGIDVGSSAIKAVRMVRAVNAPAPTIEWAEYIPFAGKSLEPAADQHVPDLIRAAVQALQKLHPYQASDGVVVGVSGSRLLSRSFSLPNIPNNKVRSAVQFEMNHLIPIPLDRLKWDFSEQRFASVDKDAETDNKGKRIIAIAMKVEEVDLCVKTFSDMGLPVHALQFDGLAWHNWFAHVGQNTGDCPEGQQELNGEATALVDVGEDSSLLLIRGNGVVWFRVLPGGGRDFTRALSKSLLVTLEQAEQLKRCPTATVDLSMMLKSVAEISQRFCDELVLSIRQFQLEYPELSVTRGWLAGGGARQFGLLRKLTS